MNVAIQGRGVAASCCAHLLAQAGIEVGAQVQASQLAAQSSVPAILLGDVALGLLRDVSGRPALFANRPRVTRRVVSWGGNDPISVPHDAIVVSGDEIKAALNAGAIPPGEAAHRLMICTAHPFPAGDVRHFGARRTFAVRVAHIHEEDQASCWTESVENGWLFFIPAGAGNGWLFGVGAEPKSLLKQSRHLASRISPVADCAREREPEAFSFYSHPRIASALQGSGWLACGTAALGFDPICGDGTAQAIREAILASAAIVAIRDGQPAEDVRFHYEAMLIAAMRRHLKLCGKFYQGGGDGDWWHTQFDALVDGYDWCSGRLGTMPEPRYALRGFRLVLRRMVA